MFELADRLVGIYKTHDCTKSVTIDPKSFAIPVKEDVMDGDLQNKQEARMSLGPVALGGGERGVAVLGDVTNLVK